MNIFSSKVSIVIGMAVLIFMAGCAKAVKDPVSLDEFSGMRPVLSEVEYRIQPGDLIDIKFFYNPELNEQITVRPDGRISMQLANEVMVSGLTAPQLSDILKEKYSRELRDPEISVIVRSFSAQKVFVDGEVARPGLIALGTPMTVLQSISQAGGITDTARMSEVIVIRRMEDNPENVKSVMLDLEKALDGSDKRQDIELRPYDIVFVPKTHVSNVNDFVDQYIRKNIPVSLPFGLL